MKRSFIITGIGGQGTIFLVKLIGRCSILENLPFIGTETHGMAQRGGTVINFAKVGSFSAPLVRKAGADFLIGLDRDETLRFVDYLKEGGTVVVNAADFPQIPSAKVVSYDVSSLALSGRISPKSLNVFVFGMLSCQDGFPFSKDTVLKALKELNERFYKQNEEALLLGMEVAGCTR